MPVEPDHLGLCIQAEHIRPEPGRDILGIEHQLCPEAHATMARLNRDQSQGRNPVRQPIHPASSHDLVIDELNERLVPVPAVIGVIRVIRDPPRRIGRMVAPEDF